MATWGGQFSHSINLASDETFVFVCTPCERENKNKEAVNYCTACGEYFCTTCIEHHNKFPGMSDHRNKLLGQSEMRNKGPQTPRAVPKEKCAAHDGKPVDMICQGHDKIGCTTCMTLEHRSCEDLDYIPDIATGISKSAELKNVKSDLEKVKSNMTKLKSSRKTDQTRITKEKDEGVTTIKDFRKRMNNILDKLEKSATDEMDKRYKSLYAGMQADINTCDAIITAMETRLNQIESADASNESQLFVDVKRGKESAENAGKERDEMSKVRHEIIEFNIDPTIEANLNKLKSLGNFTEESIQPTTTAMGQVGTGYRGRQGKGLQQNEQKGSRVSAPANLSAADSNRKQGYINRFTMQVSCWVMNMGNKTDAITFTASRDIRLDCVCVYGTARGSTEITLTLKDKEGIDLSVSKFNLTSQTPEHICEVEVKNANEAYGVELQANQEYHIVLSGKGGPSYSGYLGHSHVSAEGVDFQFINSQYSTTTGTSVTMGQIPGFKFTVL